jgi:hypothetical protein
VFKIFNKGWKKQKQADKQTAKAMFQCITLLGAYVNIEQLVGTRDLWTL